MIPDYTLVIGVDARHLRQLCWTWPTWMRHKRSLLEHPILAFYDETQVKPEMVQGVMLEAHRARVLRLVAWPPDCCFLDYGPEGKDKWTDPQRYKMLCGFVHVGATVDTPYWLKLDTDVVAAGMDDWFDPRWFDGEPAIVSHPWSFTKPADQMLKLDAWVAENADRLPRQLTSAEPLRLEPRPGWERLKHQRIISFCGFFRTDLTKAAAACAEATIAPYQMPVRSQDGYLWYMATRLGLPVVRANMKRLGFQHWSGDRNVEKYAKEAMR